MDWRALIFALAVLVAATVPPGRVSAEDVRLIGSGASFPFPIYSAWFKTLVKKQRCHC